MKKNIKTIAMAAATLLMVSCGAGTTGLGTTGSANNAGGGAVGGILSTVLGAATDGQTLGNVLQSVLGLDKVTKADLYGTWKYAQPGCAFTSENLLAQAGGEAAATAIKQKVQPTFQKVGINSQNTQITFNENGTFKASIAGHNFEGTYTYDEANYKITMQALLGLLNINCYAKKNSNGLGVLFESTKLLTMLQTVAQISGNSTVKTIGDLSKNYDGLRVGFDMQK